MVQEVFFFTEMAYSAYPQDVAERAGYTALMLPNANFDAHKAHALYQGYFEEYQYAGCDWPKRSPCSMSSRVAA